MHSSFLEVLETCFNNYSRVFLLQISIIMVFNISNGTVGWLEYQQTKYMIGLLFLWLHHQIHLSAYPGP